MSASKRVAVVGAGPSGLATVKELLEEGHEPVCFERAASLGGVFRFDEDAGVVWESCRLTSSGLLTAFSDFPVAPDRAAHMKTSEYVDYLTQYCDAFGVGERLRFGTSVEAVTPGRAEAGASRRSAATASGARNVTTRSRFAPAASEPAPAALRRQETFPGRIMHGAEYRRPAEVAGKRVLVIGAGESGRTSSPRSPSTPPRRCSRYGAA
jgi:cation diffusion facilitator CzcD-associated flavoprotein CzcO